MYMCYRLERFLGQLSANTSRKHHAMAASSAKLSGHLGGGLRVGTETGALGATPRPNGPIQAP